MANYTSSLLPRYVYSEENIPDGVASLSLFLSIFPLLEKKKTLRKISFLQLTSQSG